MQLCLIRHAIAVERGTAGYVDDRVRPLTPEGRKRMREAALGLKGVVSLDAIATSDVTRYEAEMLGFIRDKHADVLADIRTSKDLSGDATAKLKAALDAFAKQFA